VNRLRDEAPLPAGSALLIPNAEALCAPGFEDRGHGLHRTPRRQ
jgi:hypothetical protein